MIRKFGKDTSGNYALMTTIVMVPLMGALALGIDYSSMVAQKQQTMNALDAAGIATARRIAEGATDAQALAYAQDFFKANLGHVDPKNAKLTVILPNNNTGGGTLKLTGALKYKPYFLPAAEWLVGKTSSSGGIDFAATSEIRLKDTLEVSLVLDNSGSMTELGKNSNKQRMLLVKDAAKQLVDQLAAQAQQMKQIDKAVQFSVVPFAASVNVGSSHASDTWMDTTGISPIHHENFDWTTLSQTNNSTKYAQKTGAVWYARGTGWDATQKDKPLTRFSLYNQVQRMTGSHQVQTGTTQTCTTKNKKTTCVDTPVYTTVNDYAPAAAWSGCMESRPSPYDVNDTAASASVPSTLFVPMFAPDETDNKDSSQRVAYDNWRGDVLTGTGNDAVRQRYMPKYFTLPTTVSSAYGQDAGPNLSCTTTPITPLTDVSKTAGATTVKAAIDAMAANGATNVPEAMAWGWRTLSSGAPFTEGRPETEKGNDKVVIVLTDGANTYYTPSSLGGNDLANSKSIYSALGYLQPYSNGFTYGRMFLGTSSAVSKTDFSNANYTKALNEHFATLCANAKAGNLIVMTIAVDLDSTNTAEATQIAALKACSSDSRFRKDPTDPTKPAKLFWNSTGASLSQDFKEIGNELSNLRIVS